MAVDGGADFQIAKQYSESKSGVGQPATNGALWAISNHNYAIYARVVHRVTEK